MAIPTIVINTESNKEFLTQQPTIEMTGSDADGHDLAYGIATFSTNEETPASVPSMSVIFYANGIYVGQESSGLYRSLYSYDGLTWNFASGGITGRASRIYHLNGRFFMTGTSKISFSLDGINWAPEKTITSRSYKLAYGNGMYILSGDSLVGYSTSTDGDTWTTRDRVEGFRIIDQVVFADGQFSCIFHRVSDSSRLFMVSSDGLTWTEVPELTPGLGFVRDMIYFNNRWIIVGSAGSSNVPFKHSTGETGWVDGFATGASSSIFNYVHDTGRALVAVGSRNSTGAILAFMSFDGIMWFSTLTGPVFELPLGVPVQSAAISENKAIYLVSQVAPALSVTSELTVYHSNVDVGFVNSNDPVDQSPFSPDNQIEFTYPQMLSLGAEYKYTVAAQDTEGIGSRSNLGLASRQMTILRPPNTTAFMQFII